MNRRTLLTVFLLGIIGFALPALAQSGKLSQVFGSGSRPRASLARRSRLVTSNEAVVKINKRYPGCTILNLKPV